MVKELTDMHCQKNFCWGIPATTRGSKTPWSNHSGSINPPPTSPQQLGKLFILKASLALAPRMENWAGSHTKEQISWTGTQHAMKSFDWGWEKESRTGACAAEPKPITHSIFYWNQASCLSLTQILTPGPSVKNTVMKITWSKAGGCDSGDVIHAVLRC